MPRYVAKLRSDADPQAVTAELEGRGVRIVKIRKLIGIITFEAEPTDVPEIMRLEGVAGVDHAQTKG